ncbi:MAG: hypothetical protein KDE59_21895 [Anaerolineales bacterium]|nr:hypothetical protein [Anaerolineales bacterium]
MSEKDIYDLGLPADLQMWQQSPLNRRRFLKMGLASMLVVLAGCQTDGSEAATETATTESSSESTNSAAVCVDPIPSETAGPYPADGSQASNQTLNALALAGIVRSDIRTSLGTGNTATGIPCNIELTLVNTNADCAPLAGHALYIWHCDQAGNYSLYSSDAVAEDYLRGVQVSDSDGKVNFVSVFPACYAGRWPHAHFEIYRSLDEATSAANVLHTSQLALPEDTCDLVYATDGYTQSVRNLAQLSLATDNVFRDGVDSQLAAVTGDNDAGYTVRLTVGVPA